MKKIKVEFTEKNLTGNAGLIRFGRFIKKLGLAGVLESRISIPCAANADYKVCDAVNNTYLGVL